MSAFEDLNDALEEGEKVEGIAFGEWGWGGYGEGDDDPMPKNMRGRVLTLAEAEPHMQSWSFRGGYGAPECPATYIWTDRRILWVTQYDGSTGLDSAPRNPIDCIPEMPGG